MTSQVNNKKLYIHELTAKIVRKLLLRRWSFPVIYYLLLVLLYNLGMVSYRKLTIKLP